MNPSEIRFQQLLRRVLQLSRLLPWATFSIACGGSSIDEPGHDPGNHDAGGQANHGGDAAGGSAASGGHASVCHAAPPQFCAGGPITLPRSCVSDEMASVGTALSIATCQTMCQSMFTFSCSVSAVEQTSITVQCVTGCPLAP